jgi:RNA polymerase sigma-70 factor (ECF subfamily)
VSDNRADGALKTGAVISSTRDELFRRIYHRNFSAIAKYMRRRVLRGTQNELDLVSEVFMVAWRRLDDMPSEPEDLPWLYGVARNVLLRHARVLTQRARLQIRVEAQPIIHMEIDVKDTTSFELIREAVDRLDEPDREMLRLAVWEQLTYVQIGVIFDVSDNAVELRLRRARSRLKETLRPLIAGDDNPMPPSPTSFALPQPKRSITS